MKVDFMETLGQLRLLPLRSAGADVGETCHDGDAPDRSSLLLGRLNSTYIDSATDLPSSSAHRWESAKSAGTRRILTGNFRRPSNRAKVVSSFDPVSS